MNANGGPQEPKKGPGTFAVGCLSRALAWAVVVFAARLLFAGGWLVRGLGGGFEYVFGRSPWRLGESVAGILIVTWVYLALLQAVLGDRAQVLQGYGKVLLWGFNTVKSLVVGVARLAWMTVEGRPEKPRTRRSGKDEC